MTHLRPSPFDRKMRQSSIRKWCVGRRGDVTFQGILMNIVMEYYRWITSKLNIYKLSDVWGIVVLYTKWFNGQGKYPVMLATVQQYGTSTMKNLIHRHVPESKLYNVSPHPCLWYQMQQGIASVDLGQKSFIFTNNPSFSTGTLQRRGSTIQILWWLKTNLLLGESQHFSCKPSYQPPLKRRGQVCLDGTPKKVHMYRT